ncbi:hypothetical protein ACLMJK_002441 [Lecanora helva]
MSDQKKPGKISGLMKKLSKSASTSQAKSDANLSILKQYDIVFLIDDSGSMSLDRPTRWDQVRTVLQDIAHVSTQWDEDGIDIHFLNNEKPYKNVKKAKHVMKIFNNVIPIGGTYTERRLRHILRPYIRDCEIRHMQHKSEPKLIDLIVITDGIPSDDPINCLTEFAKRLDAIDANLMQVGVQFVQVGDDAGAAANLEELDNLHEENDCRDIVDTVSYAERIVMGAKFDKEFLIEKVLLGAINKKLDRMQLKNQKAKG